MSELKNNKHNTYYCYTNLYIVNAVICKLLLGQLTNHNTFRLSEGGSSSNPELIGSLCQAGERGIVIM